MIKQNMQNQYTLWPRFGLLIWIGLFVFSGTQTGRCDCPTGLWSETTYHRCDNGKTHWYAMDLPHVIEYRRDFFPEPERELYISGDAFAKDWIKKFAMMYLMLLFSLLQAGYFII